MNHWYSDSDEEYELEQQDNTPDELDAIYSSIDSMIDYVVKRYLDNRTYEYHEYITHYYIRDYYLKKLKIVITTNTVLDVLNQYRGAIQERVNLTPDAIRQQ